MCIVAEFFPRLIWHLCKTFYARGSNAPAASPTCHGCGRTFARDFFAPIDLSICRFCECVDGDTPAHGSFSLFAIKIKRRLYEANQEAGQQWPRRVFSVSIIRGPVQMACQLQTCRLCVSVLFELLKRIPQCVCAFLFCCISFIRMPFARRGLSKFSTGVDAFWLLFCASSNVQRLDGDICLCLLFTNRINYFWSQWRFWNSCDITF